ncbi:MAG: hypothetical protein ABII88_03590 [Candidatus Omnitrophota bacterium]
MQEQDKLKFKGLFGIAPEEAGEAMIISPFFNMRFFKQQFKKHNAFKGMVFKGINGIYKNKKITYVNTGMGYTLVGDCVLAQEITNVKKIIFLGAVGSVDGLEVGDCVIVQKAFFEKEYYKKFGICGKEDSLESGFFPDEFLVNNCEMLAREQKIAIKKVDVMSVHSFWEENAGLAHRLRQKNIQAVELECAGFYALAALSKIKALALCFVSDHIMNRPYWSDFSLSEKSKMLESTQSLVNLALECALVD